MAKNIIRCTTILMLAFGITSLIEEGMASEDLHVFVNDSVVISCFPNRVLSVQWHHTPPGKSSSKYVYAGGRFYFPYNTSRFSTYNNSTTNTYTFVITNVTLEDAGFYECKDDVLSGVFGSTQLIVLNSSPVCNSNMHPDGFIGPNKCDIQKENMTFSCAVSFAGKTPSLMWRSFNDNQSLVNSVCATQPNHINCSLTLKADPEYDGTVFICETKASIGARFNCSTEVVKVHYFSADNETSARKVHENVSCIVRNSNLETRYNWTIEQNGQYVFLSSSRTVVMKEPGIHRCDVEYSIRNNTCYFLTSVVNASEATDSSGSQKEQGNVLAIALPIVLSVVLLAVIVGFVIFRERIKGKAFFQENPKSSIGKSIARYKSVLLNSLDVNAFLLADLLGDKVIDERTKERILSTDTRTEVNERFLDWLQDRIKAETAAPDGGQQTVSAVMKALNKDDQEHIVNLLEGKEGGELPLSPSTRTRLFRMNRQLTDMLSVDDGLLESMLSEGAINHRHYEAINAKATASEKSLELMEIVLRRSNRTLDCLLKALKETNREHIACQIEEDERGALLGSSASVMAKTKMRSEKAISGMAIVDRELFITYFLSQEIRIYDSTSLEFIRTIKIVRLTNAWDMKHCAINRCLYIMDAKDRNTSKSILKLTSFGEKVSWISWQTQSGYGCISITFDNYNVLLAAVQEGRIKEYSPDGALIREIELSQEVRDSYLRYAIKLSDDRFLISHGESDDHLHRVCVIDAEGNIMVASGGRGGCDTNRFCVPIYLAIDSCGSIVVIDRDNSRVLELDPDRLDFRREVIRSGRDGMIRPERMALDEARGKIFIAHNSDGWKECCVFVFDYNCNS